MKTKQLLVLIGVLVVLGFARLVCKESSPVAKPGRNGGKIIKSGQMQPNEIHKFIKDLRKHRPDYLAEAKERADDMTSSGHKIRCPICETQLSILHVFPQLTFNVDPIIDTDWHVKCGNCNHEDLFTVIYQKQ